MFKFCKTQLWECSRTLSDVAMGRKPAETVIRNARLVNVCTHEILDNIDVANFLRPYCTCRRCRTLHR